MLIFIIAALILDVVGFICLLISMKKKKKRKVKARQETEYVIKGSKEDLDQKAKEVQNAIPIKESNETFSFVSDEEEGKVNVKVSVKGKLEEEEREKEEKGEEKKKNRKLMEKVDILKEQPISPFEEEQKKQVQFVVKDYEPLKYIEGDGTTTENESINEDGKITKRVETLIKDVDRELGVKTDEWEKNDEEDWK